MYKRIKVFLIVLTLCFFSLVGCSSEDVSQTVNQTDKVEVANESANTKSNSSNVSTAEKEKTQPQTEKVTQAPTEKVTEAPVVQNTQEQKAAVQEAASANNSGGGSMVWIPKSGKKYHSSSSCSNMKNPSQVPLDTAISQGYTPCSKCY